MSEKIFLEKLTLVGFRKNYEVDFKSGLNYISGPMSTGKSSIAEMINYAFGSEKHKAYIEINKSCKEVMLDFFIGEDKFRIVRPLFEFNRPVKLFRWDTEINDFRKDFHLLEVDSPSNENSLSAFLLNEIGLPNITVVNQSFSFRDLLKYAYVKQSIIDSENLLNEKSGGSGLKRKPTFEIIFNIYNELLGDLRQQLKEKDLHIKYMENKREGVLEFLEGLEVLDRNNYIKEKNYLDDELSKKIQKLKDIKSEGKYDDQITMGLEKEVQDLKEHLAELQEQISERNKYIDKLKLLRNQYSSEIQKIEFILEGAVILNKYEFEVCPSCLNTLVEKEGCHLCGNEMRDLSEQESKVFKSEVRRLKRKTTNLISLIGQQEELLKSFKEQKEKLENELHTKQRKLDHLRNQYISPFIEQIEQINYEIGNIYNHIDQLEKNLIIIDQFSKINENILQEQKKRDQLKDRIDSIEKDVVTKENVVNGLSELFSTILTEFSFPKLNNAYIRESNFLPYVRGVKYDELGSGGAVTMTTMAYFLSIALLESPNKNHPGFIIIDSPRKNLGADAKSDDEFKDEEIFNSIIKYFLSINNSDDENINNDVQIIVINNGYPPFVPQEDLIKVFDGKGTGDLPYGLIDDIEYLKE
ncbi:AAA family ATPase [Bacillus sp. NTK071]|uniref:AAA family ATPase n=1 Tax=Bacillus sp. NTK071 TaxID=2802175 RepID=UPI001A8C30D0|nr:AAA family ATPase [Bacillus sp. NTK071]MBN8211089.1 AAA family ATPase [Bacillus sp. NTK071]